MRLKSSSSVNLQANPSRELPRDYIYRLLQKTEFDYMRAAEDPRPASQRKADLLEDRLEDLQLQLDEMLCYEEN